MNILDKMGTIRNPLTIIAMFAGIAEMSGTAVLPFLSEGNQDKFIWFVIAFPILLVGALFITLNFNHRVLYAPSDFSNEDNFFRSLQGATPEERAEKLKEEVREIEAESTAEVLEDKTGPAHKKVGLDQASQVFAEARYVLAEELVLRKLSQEFGRKLRRSMRIRVPNTSFVFDGIIMRKNEWNSHSIMAVEVKYYSNINGTLSKLLLLLYKFRDIYEAMSEQLREKMTWVIAVATDSTSYDKTLLEKLEGISRTFPFKVQIRIYRLSDLESEFASS